MYKRQSQKPLGTAVDPEDLNLFVGSRPYPDSEGSDRVKLAVLDLLNQKYGITEEDFLSAELCAVPAYTAVDVGLDRSMIGSIGGDGAEFGGEEVLLGDAVLLVQQIQHRQLDRCV